MISLKYAFMFVALERFISRMFLVGLCMRAFLARVCGRVQRVGYRRFVLDSAQELGVAGYVKNEKDGSVTVFAQGDDGALERFLERLKSPPPPAQVRSVDARDAAPKPRLKYFVIKPSLLQEELQEGFGAMQSIFMDYWGEFRDYRDEFRSFVGEFRDYRDEFRSFVGAVSYTHLTLPTNREV